MPPTRGKSLESHLRTAPTLIKKAAPAFAPIIDAVGPCTLGHTSNDDTSPFSSLVTSVVSQQLSTTAATTINGRLRSAAGGTLTPESLNQLDDVTLRGVGLSGAKTKTIAGLVAAVTSRELDLDELSRTANDEEISIALTALWGIGEWTSHMFLIFNLHRLDVWPVGDLGVRKGWALIHGADGDPGAKSLLGAAEHLRPYRSVAAWYCWRRLELPTPPN